MTAMRLVVAEFVLMLLLEFLSKESQSEDINLLTSCYESSNMFVTCSYNGSKTVAGFKWYLDGVICGSFKHTSKDLCVRNGVEDCNDFTHSCPDSNTMTLTVKDIMVYAGQEKEKEITCQPIDNEATLTSNKTISLKVHPTLDTSIEIEDKMSTKREENIRLWIKVVAVPTPSFKWSQKSGDNWQPISSHENRKIVSTNFESKLTIFRVMPAEEGWYKVTVVNDCGEVEQQFHLEVEDDKSSMTRHEDTSSTPEVLAAFISALGGLLMVVVTGILVFKILSQCLRRQTSGPRNM